MLVQECCGQCHVTAGCVAATFLGGDKECWVKNAQDVSGGAYQRGPGRVGCTKPPSPPGPPPSPTPPPPAPPTAPAILTIKGEVPGDLLTDLQLAGKIGDPLFELVFKNATLWDSNAWVYSTTFSVAEHATTAAAGATTVLVFDGIKMGATVKVNGEVVGIAADQFLRYTFAIKPALLRSGVGANTVEVVFDKSVSCGGRWMACTGGWDWVRFPAAAHV
jgi:hypothetical protein